METYPHFLYPVSEYGLPLSLMVKAATGDEGLKGLSPEAFTKLYWTLMGLRVHYAFSANGRVIERRYEVPVWLLPHERSVQLPFCGIEVDEAHAAFGLNLGLGSPTIEVGGTVAVDFLLFDESAYGLYSMGTRRPKESGGGVTYRMSVFEQEMDVYLKSFKGSAEIQFVEIEPVWAMF